MSVQDVCELSSLLSSDDREEEELNLKIIEKESAIDQQESRVRAPLHLFSSFSN